MKKSFVRCLILFNLVLCSTAVFAEGSKELNANGGHRAYLVGNGNPFRTGGLVRVYVNENETIYLGSSAQGVNGGTIYLRSPSGTLYSSGNSATGRINNRSQELAGPISGGYTPFKRLAEESGVWSVFFIGSTYSINEPGKVLSVNDWPVRDGGDNSSYVAAFDVSVSQSASAVASSDFIKGRAYMNVFSGRLGDFEGQFGGVFQVLTNDGYNYKVDANGLAGHEFVFFSNNKGYRNADGTASYRSKNNTNTDDLHDPRLLDNISTNDITHKLFFNIPDPNLPNTARIRSNDGSYNTLGLLSTTWLKTTPVLPVIKDFEYTGIEDTPGKAGTFPLSGFISFDSNQSGTYTITIDVDNNGASTRDVILRGNAISGINRIAWDGKDANGAIVQGTLNASSITVGLKAGEVHFPYIDVENNPDGIEITRAGGGVGTTTVYWDDFGISQIGTPSNPITQLDGVNSVGPGSNGHKFGSTNYNGSDFGNNKGLDTWTYLLSAPIASSSSVQLRQADLQVVSLTSDRVSAEYCIGETVTYTAVIKNNGPDDVSGAKIAFDFPGELTLTTAPTYTSTGSVSITENPSTSTKVSALVDMANQATITLTVTGTITTQPTGAALNTTASILRPADVTDPDATDPNNAQPSDPDHECNFGTPGCNNIITHAAAVPVSDISIVATSAFKSERNPDGTLTDMTFTVSLSAPNNGCPITVNYALKHTTSNDEDFDFTLNPASGLLTFTQGELNKVITFKVNPDLMVEGDETFLVELSNVSSGGKIINGSAIGTINNDDTINQIEITKDDGEEGGTNGSFTFTFPGGESFDVDTPIPYKLSGTAIGGGTDYTAAGTFETITIPAGSNSVTLDLSIFDDGLTEGDETVIISPGIIANKYNASIPVITPIPVVSIADNDPATLTITGGFIVEGDSDAQDFTFNVTLSNPTQSSFDISYATADGTALAGEDYIANSGTLTFTGIAETKTITIRVNGDWKIEQHEAFTIALSGLTKNFGGQLTVVGSPATGTIRDNDNTSENKIITITPTNGQELGPLPGVFTFSFPRDVSTDQPTTIVFGLTGTAGAADYTGAATSITIPAGATTATLTLPVLADDIVEGPESVIITTTTVTNISYPDIVVANSPQTLNIIDDDSANIITGAVTVTEGDNGMTNMIFNVELTKATGSSFTIAYTISDGTAKAGEDYTTPSGSYTGTLTFDGHAETQHVTVQVFGDQKIETDETLTFTLGTPSNTFDNLLAVQFSPAIGTIEDDDNIPSKKIITITKANGYEKIGPDASFTFSLPDNVTVETDTEISYSLSGDAIPAGGDYTGAPSGTIRILAGQTTATLNLPVVDDEILEGDESVIVTVNGISNLKYEPFTVSNSGLALTIVDDDNTVLLSSPAFVEEGDIGTKTVRFKVSVDLATSAPFSVKYSTSDGTAIAGEDYVAQFGTLNFDANSPDQFRYIDIIINGDRKIEKDETFVVTLHDLNNDFNGTLSLSGPVTMIIEDDDNRAENKIVSISKIDGAEPGQAGTFILSLPPNITVDAATTVNYVLSGTAQNGGIDFNDIELSPIVIPAGVNKVTLDMVDVVDDYIIEGTESVLMTITSVFNPEYAGFAGDIPVALDIIDNDNTAINNVITLTKVQDGSESGQNAQFMVSFPTSPNAITASVPTTVNYVVSGTAASGLDYTILTGSVVIEAGNSWALIDVLVIDDQVIEDLEKVELTLTTATNSISNLTVGPGMVSADIVDNDNIPRNNIITLSRSMDGLEGGSDGKFKVSFPSGITSAVDTEVRYTVSASGTAAAGSDYKVLTGSVIIPAGAEFADIDVEVIDDKIIESTETVLLALQSATNSIAILTVQPGNLVGVSIVDNDNSIENNIISISLTKNASEPAEDGLFRISYPRDISSAEATVVSFTISGSAENGTDYILIPLTATIEANTNFVDVKIDVIDDKIIEATETVEMTLTAARNTSFNPTVVGTPKEIDIEDEDNNPDNNRIQLIAVDHGSEPSDAGQFTVGFPNNFVSSEETVVHYRVGGTATSGSDYTALTGSIIIPVNSGPVPIDINVLDDDIIEGTETVTITLDHATNPIITSLATLPNSAVSINIEDDEDDDPNNNIITLTKTDGSEPGSNPTFKLSYPNGITSSKPTQITYSIGGTAKPGIDYQALSGTAVIDAGSEYVIIQVPVIDDYIIEGTETVELTINSANNNISALTWSPLVALSADIADNDQANHNITLTRIDHGYESGPVKAQFLVSFPENYSSSGATTVNYTIGGNATAGTDYIAPSGILNIPAGHNSALIEVEILDDLIIEQTEIVSLTLTGATNENSIPVAILPNGSAVTANIYDNDISNNIIYLELVRNGKEGGDNPQFKVSFPSDYSSPEPTVVSFGVTGTNTATLNEDYTMPFYTVTIPAYTNSEVFEIPVTNDFILEPTESFRLILTGATNNLVSAITYQIDPVSANIEDDDNVLANNVISLTKETDGVEANTPPVFKVSFPPNYTNSVATTVNYVVSGGTALEGTDYTIVGQVIIPAGSGSATFQVPLIDDLILEATETVQLTLVDATNTIFSPITVNLTPATANILDDDSSVANNKLITITPDDGAEVTMPGLQNPASFTFQFPSNIRSSAETTISYVLTGNAIGNGTDFTGNVSGTVTIPAMQNSVTLQLPVTDDDIVEGEESITVTTGQISNVDVSGISVNNSPLSLKITDNDVARLSVNSVSLDEGDGGDTRFIFTVTLDKATGGSFNLEYSTGDLSAKTADNDYIAKRETLSFAGTAGETVEFIIHVNGDEKIEEDETFQVNFSAPDKTFGGRLTMPVPTTTGTILNDDSGTISISSNPGSEADPNPNGASFTFSFPSGKSSDQPTTIHFGLSAGSTATITDDYIFPALTGSVTIPAGDNSQTITLPVVDDTILERTETITLTVGSIMSPYGLTVTNPTASTTILDNDAATVSLSTLPTVNEDAGTAIFRVTLSADVQETFRVDYTTSNGTAQAPDDFASATSFVSFPADSKAGDYQEFRVTIQDDTLVEPGERFSAKLTAITGLATIDNAEAWTEILDDDVANVAISPSTTIDEGAGKAIFTVTLNGDVQEAFSVDYTTTNGTAIAPGDYTHTQGTIHFPAGSQSGDVRTIEVPIVDDTFSESAEDFSITLSNITGLATINRATATTTITDNDGAGVSISTNATVPETNGFATFTVTLSGDVQDFFTVSYATSDGTAIAPGDYTNLTGSVTFGPGSRDGTIKIIQIPIVSDGVAEPEETFSVTLTSITGQTAIVSGTAETMITDNNRAGISLLAPATVNEIDGKVVFTVKLSGDVQDAFSVEFNTVNGTAQAPGDFLAQRGTVNFAAGSLDGTTQTFEIELVNDIFAEVDERFSVQLSNIDNPLVVMGTATQSVIINDDDVSSVSISTNATVNEGDGMATFIVTLTGGIQDAVTMNYATVDGSAVAPGDYTATLAGPVSFAAGSQSGEQVQIRVPIQQDDLREPGETFSVNLSNINGIATIATPNATTTITDNNLASVTISTTQEVNEGDGIATFKVTLSGNVTQDFTVNFETVDGTATQPNDFTYTSGSIPFSAGSNDGEERTITVPILNDLLAEGSENFSVKLTSVTGGLVTISNPLATTTIVDNDAASVSISAQETVNEGASSVMFTVTLTGGIQDAISVDYALADDSAIAPDDYTKIANGTFTFPAGSVSGTLQTFTVPIIDDDFTESDETFSASISNITGGLATIAMATAETTIIDNDLASVSISTDPTVDEIEGRAAFIVTLTGNVQDAFTVDYIIEDGTAQAPNDYTAVTDRKVVFQAGSTSGTRTFYVPLINDDVLEPDEDFSVRLTGITGLATISTPLAQTTIIDDDAASVAILTPLAVDEDAGKVRFEVMLTGNVQDAFEVKYTTSGLTAQSPGDFTHTFDKVVFNPGSRSGDKQTFEVPILNDDILERDETFSVTLSGITGTTTIGSATAIATIRDDDEASVTITTDPTVNEAAGTALFKVTLTGNVQEAFTMKYATSDGDAIAPGDYANSTGTVTFGPNSLSGTVESFPIAIREDDLLEANETFTVTLSDITGLTTLSGATATATITDNNAAELSITGVTISEGDGGSTDMRFTVKLNNATARPFHVEYTTVDGTATAANHDYEPALARSTVNFTGFANETRTITVKVYGDKIIEGDENFMVVLGAISETFGGRLTLNSTQNRAAGTIRNDDSGEITITKIDGAEGGPTEGSFIFSLLSGVTSEQPIVINYTLGGSATSIAPNADYIGTSSGTVTIAAGESRVVLALPIIDDEIVEDDEWVTIDASMRNVNGGVTLNAPRPVVTIKDNDLAKLTLSGPVTLVETNTGTTSANFTVTLDKKTSGSFYLNYATADGTAKAGDNDYISRSADLHFAGNAGESHQVTVPINGDKKIEQDEFFRIILSNLNQTFNNRLTIPVNSTTATIQNDDSGLLTIIPVNGAENGTPGISPASFTFQFSDPDVSTDVPIVISYGLSGSAISFGTDYDFTTSPALGSIILPANAKSVKLTLNVVDDQIVEGTETVILATNTGGLPYGISISNSPQSLDITDNDRATLSIGDATITEGDSGMQNITFSVTLDRATGRSFTIPYATVDRTATEGEDYLGRTDVLNFIGRANEVQTITVQVKGDQKIEGDETFTVTLGTPSHLSDVLSIPSPVATGTIIDNDNNAITLSKIADGEEPLTNGRFRVTFANAGVTSTEAIMVSYTVAGLATNGVDYTALNGSVTIPAGSNEAFIDVEVIDDDLIEPTETVILTLTAARSNSFTFPVQLTPVSLNIIDEDQVLLTVSNPVVTEGNNGTITATFNVMLASATPRAFQVAYNTTDGTATVADNDYTAKTGTLNFNGTAGEIHSIPVIVNGDKKIERDETFNMVLNPSTTFGGRLSLVGLPAIGKIRDDDNIPANKKITITKMDGMEGLYNGSFTFSFPAGITTDAATTIPFILGGTAFRDLDYLVLSSNPIVIPPGVNNYILPIPVIDDAIMEGTETLQLITGGIGNNRYNGITVETPVPIINILDNDFSQLTISSPTIREGNSGGTLITFDVKLNGATGAGFTVDYATEDGTATLYDYDYNFTRGTLVFNGTVEGETKTISVWINGDINVEDDENFRVVLSGLSKTFGGALSISAYPGVGTILNDDVQPVASDDIISTDEDTPVTFSVTDNDVDVDGSVNPESIAIVNTTLHGTLLVNPDGTLTYTPEAHYNGNDGFTYKVNDNTGIESNIANVTIVVNAVNDAPVAVDDEFFVLKDGSLNASVNANDIDLDGDQLRFTVEIPPAHGRLDLFNPNDGSFVYVPDNGYVGIDHFIYRACDAPGLCSNAQVTLYVQPKVMVKLTPSVATITEGDLISVTAEIGEQLFQDVEFRLSFSGSAVQPQDYSLEGDYIRMVIPAGALVTTQKFTIRSVKDFLKEGDETVQVRVHNVSPSDFVESGPGSAILIKDFYPEDKELEEHANGDINPDPLASPNGDGLGNEQFIIHNIERYPDNEVLIFNRWGNMVFQVKGYNNRDKAFGGVANTGLLVNKNSVLADGVYFFIIHTKDSTGALKVNKGSVIIRR